MTLEDERRLAAHTLAGLVRGKDTWDPRADLWDALAAHGLTHPFEHGADDFRLASTLFREAGRHALGVHLAENVLVSWLLARTGVTCASPWRSLADPTLGTLRYADGQVAGTLRAVPHAGLSSHLMATARDPDDQPVLVLLEVRGAVGRAGRNVAGEPRHDLILTQAPATPCAEGEEAAQAFSDLGALMRTTQMLGQAEWVLESCLAHVRTREQFDRPLSAFQAVRHLLAELAGEVAAAQMAVSLASGAVQRAAERGRGLAGMAAARPALTAARCQSADLAEVALRVGHQLHGAMGYTREHALHARSLRLMAYRSEMGGAAPAARWLGRRALSKGAESLWPDIAGDGGEER